MSLHQLILMFAGIATLLGSTNAFADCEISYTVN
jgi:hypothetical protein